MCLITLLSCYANLRNFGTLVLSYELLFTTSRTLPSCMFVPMATPFLNHLLLYRGSSYPCTLTPDWFSLLSLCPDGQRWICFGWWGIMDSRELTRGGWISCTFVGHPEGLWVHHLPRVLDTWGHDHRPAPSWWSEGEDFSVPDQSYLERVGV
jgi:hypothetical protein